MKNYIVILLILFSSCKKTEKPDVLQQSVDSLKTAPKRSLCVIKNPDFPTEKVFGLWTTDTSGVHADIQLSKEGFRFLSFVKEEKLPFEISQNEIRVYEPNDQIKTGLIKKAENDTLKIYWASGEHKTYWRYF